MTTKTAKIQTNAIAKTPSTMIVDLNYQVSNFLVELNGALSNPLVNGKSPLIELSALYHKLLARKKTRPKKPRVIKPRVGLITETVYLVLSEAGRSMRAKDIQLACQEHLGHEISWSTVKDCLSEHSKGPSSKYLKVGYGRYMVRP